MSIKVENLKYVYSPKGPFERIALNDVSFTVEDVPVNQPLYSI